jgi:HTH-type transcriptional regulator, transcriptional repressor of NAD biosynthesis genes
LKRGLVIGKFMPVHAGHVALIDFAAAHCDEVIVSMSYTPSDPIPFQKRFDWLKEIFRDKPNIRIEIILDDFDHPQLPSEQRTKIWADKMKVVYPKIDLIFSSESYGESFAKNLEAKHMPFDEERRQFPVSASQIRQKPMTNWQFIPEPVRPYFVKKICFYGAESTGKSSMAIKMAEKYNTVFVPEVAREMLTTNDFTVDDIVNIGKAHFERIIQATHQANKILFCDTDVLTTQIYSKHYLKVIPDILFELEEKMIYDRYFLFNIDVPWIADGLRDLGNQREEMHEIFKDALIKRSIAFVEVKGTWDQREAMVSSEIGKLLRDE